MPRTAVAVVLVVLGLLIAVGVLPASALILGLVVAFVGAALLA